MLKITLGLVTALMLAACAYTGPQTAAVPAPTSPMTSGVGHPDDSYPGPRAY
jgi:hypothetical protein